MEAEVKEVIKEKEYVHGDRDYSRFSPRPFCLRKV